MTVQELRAKAKQNWYNRNYRQTWHDAVTFLQAMVSHLTDNPISEEQYNERRIACLGSIMRNVPKCPLLVQVDAGDFCGGCSCGTSRLAKIGTGTKLDKLRAPKLKCPIDAWDNEKWIE
jgi:hypothetical protein